MICILDIDAFADHMVTGYIIHLQDKVTWHLITWLIVTWYGMDMAYGDMVTSYDMRDYLVVVSVIPRSYACKVVL